MEQTLKEILKELKKISEYIENYRIKESEANLSDLIKQGKI